MVRVGIGPLDRAESVQLLRAAAGPAVFRSRPDGRPRDPATDVDAVARLCGDLPLALRITGTRLASRPQWTVADLVDSLTPAEHRLASLSCGDTSVAAAFALSHAQLSEPARTLFRRLARLPGTDVAAPVATALLDTGPVPVAGLLDELVECGLLEPRGPERYRFHDLVRLFAADRLRVEEEEPVYA